MVALSPVNAQKMRIWLVPLSPLKAKPNFFLEIGLFCFLGCQKIAF